MNTKRFSLAAVFLALTVASLFVTLSKRREIRRLQEEVDAALLDRNEQRMKQEHEIARLMAAIEIVDSQIGLLSRASEEVGSPTASASGPSPSGILDDWLFTVNRLSQYQDLHRELVIPEMNNLEALDWLETTSSLALVSEADYRKAMARLRKAAKDIAMHSIVDTLQRYQNENDGQFPRQASELLRYSQGTLTLDILNRYQVPAQDDASGQQSALVEKNLVDPIWDSRLSFLRAGGVSFSRDSSLSFQRIEKAFSDYEKEKKRPPAGASELVPYLRDAIAPDLVEDAFRAMTTIPEFDHP